MNRIVLAYSGSPAAADAVGWLLAGPGGEVVTLTLDLGQGKELEAVRDRALAMGAVRAHVLDAHDTFVRDYLLRALKAGALADGGRSLVPLLTRPLIAQKLVEVAAIEQAGDVAHVCDPDDGRIAAAVAALAPQLRVVAVPRSTAASAPGGRAVPPASEPAVVEMTFERGAPVALNGIAMPLLDLLGSLEIIARAHRVGAPRVLDAAHADLQQAVAPGRGDDLQRRYVGVIDRGDWFAPERAALDADVAKLQDRVNGTVRLRLADGACEIVDRKPAKSARKLTLALPHGADTAPSGPRNL